MKRTLIIIVLVALISCSRNNVKIKGSVDGGTDSWISVEHLDVNRTSVVDSVKVEKDGSFSLSLKIYEPGIYILRNDQGNIINLLPSPGEDINILTSNNSFGKNYEIEGSDESEKIRSLVLHLQETRFKLDSLELVAASIQDENNPRFALIQNSYIQTVIKQKRYTIRFLVENMKSLSSVYALYQKYDEENYILNEEADLQYFIAVADSLEVSHPNTSLITSLRADITSQQARFQERQQLNSLLNSAIEADLMGLSIADRNGNEIRLSSLKGNVVMVFFWASGNQKSVNALIDLQSIYNRYHSQGFEVYAISLDNDKLAWMSSMDFNEFDWFNVSELSYPDSKAGQLYNVTELPANYLINREGEVVEKNLYGRTLAIWLDNLL